MKEEIRKICEAKEWQWRGRRFCYPKYNRISLEDHTTPAIALEVFEAMKLNLSELSRIFPREEKSPTNYQELGGCHINNLDSWRKLAKLTQKTIIVICFPDGKAEYEGCASSKIKFYPNGKWKQVL